MARFLGSLARITQRIAANPSFYRNAPLFVIPMSLVMFLAPVPHTPVNPDFDLDELENQAKLYQRLERDREIQQGLGGPGSAPKPEPFAKRFAAQIPGVEQGPLPRTDPEKKDFQPLWSRRPSSQQ